MTDISIMPETLLVYCFRPNGTVAFKLPRPLRVVKSGHDAGKFCVTRKGACVLVQAFLGPNKAQVDLMALRIPFDLTREARLADIGLPLPRKLELAFNPRSTRSGSSH